MQLVEGRGVVHAVAVLLRTVANAGTVWTSQGLVARES